MPEPPREQRYEDDVRDSRASIAPSHFPRVS